MEASSHTPPSDLITETLQEDCMIPYTGAWQCNREPIQLTPEAMVDAKRATPAQSKLISSKYLSVHTGNTRVKKICAKQ